MASSQIRAPPPLERITHEINSAVEEQLRSTGRGQAMERIRKLVQQTTSGSLNWRPHPTDVKMSRSLLDAMHRFALEQPERTPTRYESRQRQRTARRPALALKLQRTA